MSGASDAAMERRRSRNGPWSPGRVDMPAMPPPPVPAQPAGGLFRLTLSAREASRRHNGLALLLIGKGIITEVEYVASLDEADIAALR